MCTRMCSSRVRRLLIAESQPTTDGAVATLTRSPDMELGSCGIRVVGIAPRFAATDGNAASAKDMAEFIVGKTPLGRVGQPADIAAAVACAGFADWGWVTGTMIEVACGMCSLHGVWQRWASSSQLSSASLLERHEMALAKKKRVGKRTISAKQVRKTASGRKRRKSDGTQPPKTVTSTSSPAAS